MEKYCLGQQSFMSGIQKLYKFDNNYGASVVCHDGSYGGQQGLWEIAILWFFDKDSYSITYDTPITDDVIGWLEWEEVEEYLEKIKKLKGE